MHTPTGARNRALCRLDDLPDGGARGFAPPPGGCAGLFAVRRGERVFVYLNACPHLGVPLEWRPHRFLNDDGTRIVCALHAAEFGVEDGVCLRGPCKGDRLEAVPCEVVGGVVLVPGNAGL